MDDHVCSTPTRMLSRLVMCGLMVALTWGDITNTTPKAGDCVCASTTVNARQQAGTSAAIVASLTTGSCGTIYGGVLTKDGYKWFEVKYGTERVWIAGNYLLASDASKCTAGACSAQVKQLACALLDKANLGTLSLAKVHPSGVTDNAFAFNNIRDMCNGLPASRSKYTCTECPTGTPGGNVCLTPNLLKYLTTLVSRGKVIVNELAGACHSCDSRHYRGEAVDLHNDARSAEYLSTCTAMGGWGQDEGNHIHCQFYD